MDGQKNFLNNFEIAVVGGKLFTRSGRFFILVKSAAAKYLLRI